MVALTDRAIPGLLHYVRKRLDEDLREQLRAQNPFISPGLYISIGWQNRIDGARSSGCQYYW